MPDPVSVVVTCYNLERFIGAAVRSVQAQDYAGEVQIVVVDDCSTDGSRDILCATPGIETVLHEQNGGVMRAMISGLRAARHDMVFFLDGDDIWHPQKLTRCMEKATPDTKLCTHDLWYIDSAGNDLPRKSRVAAELGPLPPKRHGAAIERCLHTHGDYVWLGSAFGVSKARGGIEAFIAFCETKDCLETCYQDWPLAVWVALETGGDMVFANQKLFGYRLHGENYSGASQTLEKLRRNLRKSRDTFRLIEDMIAEKGGSARMARTYRHVRLRYDLRLAATQPGRGQLLKFFRRSVPALGADRETLRLITRVALALLFGADRAHALVERRKA